VSARRLVPCLDVTDGGVVKGVRFEGLRSVGDPLALAARYDAEGADEIVLLHITATLEGRGPALDLVRRLADVLRVPLTVGGAVRSSEDAYALLDAGADRVAVNSAALADPTLIERLAYRYGSQAVVVAVDYRSEQGFPVRSRAASTPTPWRLADWLREAGERGAGEFLLTAIDRDGTGQGYDLEGLRTARAASARPIIASGGAGSAADVLALFDLGLADAALLASRLHDGSLRLQDLRRTLSEQGVHVRWDDWTRTT
jgi:imidazole glycerol-phosphate synthase subunit HisF